MTRYEAPAKLNLALLVSAPDSSGRHPIESLIQTIEWLDILDVEEAEEDALTTEGLDIDPDQNLVMQALRVIRNRGGVPPLSLHLAKTIPTEAGLGGGSSDAAATLLAASEIGGLPEDARVETAPMIGADVPLFLIGGTLDVSGFGETIASRPALTGFALAVAVPEFGLRTTDVYRRWDEMEGPVGEAMPPARLPPALREGIPIRNDLVPPALDVEPALADFMADLRAAWGTAVMMTGSGSACFGFFPDLAASFSSRAARGAGLRGGGVARTEAEG